MGLLRNAALRSAPAGHWGWCWDVSQWAHSFWETNHLCSEHAELVSCSWLPPFAVVAHSSWVRWPVRSWQWWWKQSCRMGPGKFSPLWNSKPLYLKKHLVKPVWCNLLYIDVWPRIDILGKSLHLLQRYLAVHQEQFPRYCLWCSTMVAIWFVCNCPNMILRLYPVSTPWGSISVQLEPVTFQPVGLELIGSKPI